MSAPRPSEADVETVLSADEVNAMTGDDIRFWIDNPFMTPDLITEKVCYWVTRSLATRDAEHEREVVEAEVRGQMRHITAEVVRGDQSLGEQEDLIADLRARLSHVEAERDAAHEAGYWAGYGEGKEEAETRDLNYDDTTARAEAAERALADRDAAIKAVREFCEEHQRQWNPGMEKAQQFTFDGGVGAAAQDVLALLPRDDAAGAGGAE